MKFWETPIGKIASHGTHDVINALLLLECVIINIEKDSDLSEKSKKELEAMSKYKKRAVEAVNYIYDNLKKLHDEQEIQSSKES